MQKRIGVPPTHNTEEELYNFDSPFNKNFTNRMQKTAKFMNEADVPKPIYDLGTKNPLREHLRKFFEIHEFPDNLDYDFDKLGEEKTIGTICCFEILEHLFNPLFHLIEMKRAIRDDGRIYISVPFQYKYLWDFRHYHEIDNMRLGWLFDKAGLEVVRRIRIPMRNQWYKHIVGFRPIIRYFTSHTRLFELKKKTINSIT